MRSLRRIGLAILLTFCGYYVILFFAQRAILYPCRFISVPEDFELTPRAKRLWLSHDQGRTPADFYPGDGVDADHPGPVVLFAHGNGELIEHYPGGLRGYTRRGWSVLMVEYRGAGSADGAANYANILSDHVGFFDLLRDRPDIDPERIVLHGRSMGGGIVAAVSRQRRPAGLVLESTYTRIADFAARLLVPSFLVRDKWDVTAAAAAYGGPTVISHAPDDAIIPYWMAEQNRVAAPHALAFESDRAHVAPMPDRFFDVVVEHLEGSWSE